VYAAAVKAQKAEAASKMHANNVKAHHKPQNGLANLKWPLAQAAPQDKENKMGILGSRAGHVLKNLQTAAQVGMSESLLEACLTAGESENDLELTEKPTVESLSKLLSESVLCVCVCVCV